MPKFLEVSWGGGAAVAVRAHRQGYANLGAARVGHQHDLEAIPEFAVVSGAEHLFQLLSLGGWQLNADHGCFPTGDGQTSPAVIESNSVTGNVYEKSSKGYAAAAAGRAAMT